MIKKADLKRSDHQRHAQTTSRDPARYLTAPDLRARGWTDKLILDHLGAPDTLKTNPYYLSGPKMRLWSAERATQIETTIQTSLDLVLSRRGARSRSALAVADRKRQAVIGEATAQVNTDFDRWSLERLVNAALAQRDGEGDWADDATKKRWAVNFARHHLTSYDLVRHDHAGQIGVHNAAEAVRNVVLESIALRWPELADEARRQKR